MKSSDTSFTSLEVITNMEPSPSAAALVDEHTEVNDQVLEDNEVNLKHPIEEQARTQVGNDFLSVHLKTHLLIQVLH